MKLATMPGPTPDGRLVIVSRDLTRMIAELTREIHANVVPGAAAAPG